MTVSKVVVVDSNVLVAGLLTNKSDSPVSRIFDDMMLARFPYAVSTELLSEYHRVLRYPMVAKLHRLADDEINNLLAELVLHAIVRDPSPMEVELPDAADRFLFSLLHQFSNGILVTGDKVLLAAAPAWASVMSPSAFAESLGNF